MERRQNIRFPAHLAVEFTILGRDTQRLSGHLQDVSEGGLRLQTAEELAPGVFLRIEVDDSILFGEVKYCCPWMGERLYGVYVEQVLVGKSELSRLIALTLHDVARISAAPAV